MKKNNLTKLISASLLSFFISCQENEEINEITCELSYETIFSENEEASSQTIAFNAIASVSEDDATFFWSVDGVQQSENSTNFEFSFSENGSYEVCIFTETPECPSGVEYCEEVVIDTIETEETDNGENDSDITCEISYEATFATNEAKTGQTVNFEATANVTEGDDAKLFWFVNDVMQEENGTSFEYNFKENGTYEVCVFTETPECPTGVEYCEEITIDNNTDCPDFGVYAEPLGNNSYLFGLYNETHDFENILWKLIHVDTQEEISLDTDNLQANYEFTQAGTYTICAIETSFCDIEKCETFEVTLVNESELTVIPGQSIQAQGNPDNICPNLTYTFSNTETTAYSFEAKIDDEANEGYVYSWSINGEFVYAGQYNVDSGKNYEYTFQETGTYSICVHVETPECGLGIEYCTDFVVE